MADCRELVCVVSSNVRIRLRANFSAGVLAPCADGRQRSALPAHGIGDDCRFPLVEDKVAGNRHSHVGIICRAGARRIRCNHRGKLFMAHGFPLVRNCRDCICHAAYFPAARQRGTRGHQDSQAECGSPKGKH